VPLFVFTFNGRRTRDAAYFNYWRPHRSLGQRAPCESAVHQFRPEGPIAISRPIPSRVDCITSIGVLHDGLYFCALQRYRDRQAPPP
jgi:hypothetical protein